MWRRALPTSSPPLSLSLSPLRSFWPRHRRYPRPTRGDRSSSSSRAEQNQQHASATMVADESVQKQAKATPTIGTHDGAFHCDEALAVYMLRHTERFKDAQVIRTRQTDTLQTLDIVVDVGGEYDPERLRFDHHQRGFDRALDKLGSSIKLSSAGLVYEHFGHQVLKSLAKKNGLSLTDEETEILYEKVYLLFVQEIDAVDNGVLMFDFGDNSSNAPKPRYKIGTHVSARVGRLNPAWNAPEEARSRDAVDRAFEKGSMLVGGELEETFLSLATEWLPARQIVASAYKERFQVDSSGQILLLETPCYWKEHLHDIESENESQTKVLYVIYSDSKSTTPSWRIQAVSKEPGSFASRKALPEPWRGIRDSELDGLLNLETAKMGAIFVHASGFIGGHQTYEGALEMARKAAAF